MGERLEAEEQLEGADESRGELAGSQQERERKEFSGERRPEEAGYFEALAGEKSGVNVAAKVVGPGAADFDVSWGR